MPGSIIHLAIAEKVYKAVKRINDDNDYYKKFIIGNILPDILTEKDKYESHCWDMDMYKRMAREPIMSIFYDKNNITNIKDMFDNPILLGYFCHLSSDLIFMKEYWEKYFVFYDDKMNLTKLIGEAMYVKVTYSNRLYSRFEFLSEKQYYGDYDIIRKYIKDKYNVKNISVEHREILESLDKYSIDFDKFDRYVLDSNTDEEQETCRVLDIKLIDNYIERTIKELTNIIYNEID